MTFVVRGLATLWGASNTATVLITFATLAGPAAVPPAKTDFWQQITATVPIAALTTVVLGFLLAGALARRQEMSKGRLAAETAIRTAVLGIRSDVVHVVAAAPFAAVNHIEAPQLSDSQLDAFAEDVVNAAEKLSRLRQRKIRVLLVELLGEARVRMAEELGPTHSRLRAANQIGLANASRAGWVVTELMPAGVAFAGGLLKQFAVSPKPDTKALAFGKLDDLAALVSGKVGLAGREPLEAITKRLQAE